MNNSWQNVLYEEYRIKFGCKNQDKVCWCEICVNVEKLIKETVKEVKNHITN